MKFKLYIIILCAFFATPTLGASELSASRQVEITAANSVDAKNRAVNDARQSLVKELLRRSSSSDASRTEAALERLTDSETSALVRSMSIENEKRSSKSYAAKITINLDAEAMADWFENRNLSFAPILDAQVGWMPVYVNVPNGLNQWIWFNAKLRDAKVQNRGGFQVLQIGGGVISGRISSDNAHKFASNVRSIGANVQNGGTLRISLPHESMQ
ncbi:MAG: hypothetical protein LBB23_03410 [Rickettsiales bacterium]|jgi:hypothetical protein|nr:hypothetical protein [Rickettsiales bacterium]